MENFFEEDIGLERFSDILNNLKVFVKRIEKRDKVSEGEVFENFQVKVFFN